MHTPLVYQIHQLLTRNKITIDREELDFQIKSHPTYPSLHSITGVLDHFNIDNLALDVPIIPETLEQLPPSFLAQVHTEQGKDFVMVNKKTTAYELIFSKKKRSTLPLKKFLEDFTGIIVAVEKSEHTETFESSQFKFGTILTGVSLILAILLFMTTNPGVPASIYFGLSLLGIIISTSILKQELEFQNLLGDTVCSGESNKTDCNAVLTADEIKILGNFKLSDLSIIYFSGLGLLSFLFAWKGLEIHTLFAISLLTLPITIYSIYYQYAVVKKWCVLCLGIVAVLWMQAALVLLSQIPWTLQVINPPTILFTMIIFTLCFTAWYYIGSTIRAGKDLKKSKVEYFKFKKDFNLFQASLKQKEAVNTTIQDAKEIHFGAQDSVSQITFITNPLCGHCKKVHTLLEDILKKNTEHLGITVRFYTNPSMKDDISVRITSRLLELFYTDKKEECLHALHEIYGDSSAADWLVKWGDCGDSETYLAILEKQSSWCLDNEINFTPEILVNGHSYPTIYERSDLIYFIDELEEAATPVA